MCNIPSRASMTEHCLISKQTFDAVENALEHRLRIRHRAADRLQHIGRRGLMRQRFRCVSLNSRTFSIAITAWSAKVRKSLT